MDPGAASLDRLLPRYPIELAAVFEDRRGRDDILISNDGHVLRTSIRGVSLSGRSFDTLDAATLGLDQPLDLDESGWLVGGTLTVRLTVLVNVAGEPTRAAGRPHRPVVARRALGASPRAA
jgi:hypothetical protein